MVSYSGGPETAIRYTFTAYRQKKGALQQFVSHLHTFNNLTFSSQVWLTVVRFIVWRRFVVKLNGSQCNYNNVMVLSIGDITVMSVSLSDTPLKKKKYLKTHF